MLPCTQIPPLDLGGLKVYPFAVLVAFGVVLAHWLAVRRAGRCGLRPELAARLGLAMAAAGFTGAWLFRMAYQPGAPSGIASFGGIFGGLVGAWLYGRRNWTGRQLLQYVDLFACAFPVGWMFGRAGCTLAHDHLGRAGGWWFTADCGGGPRYDLGFIELLYMVPVAALLVWANRKQQPPGFALGLFLTVYGPFRVLLDRLHETPPQWLFWSVDRWSGLAAALIGVGILWTCQRGLVLAGARWNANMLRGG